MICSEKRIHIVDYVGSHEQLAVDIDLSVDEEGGFAFDREPSGSI